MTTTQPTIETLSLQLPYWPLKSNDPNIINVPSWRRANIPWSYNPEEFEAVTRALSQRGTKARDMCAFLVHGVDWNHQCNDGNFFGDVYAVWESKREYLNAWVRGQGYALSLEVSSIHLKDLSWHSFWGKNRLSAVLEDIETVQKFNTTGRGRVDNLLTSIGMLEMYKTASNKDLVHQLFPRLSKSVFSRAHYESRDPMSSAFSHFLTCSYFDTIDTQLRTRLLYFGLCFSDFQRLNDNECSIIRSALVGLDDPWWRETSKRICMPSERSSNLLDLNIHPLLMTHANNQTAVQFIKDFTPGAFADGATLAAIIDRSTKLNDGLGFPDLDLDF